MTLTNFLTNKVLTHVELLADGRLMNVVLDDGSVVGVAVVNPTGEVTRVSATYENRVITTVEGTTFQTDALMVLGFPINTGTVISRQTFMDRIGDQAVINIIAASKQSVEIEAWLLRYKIVPDIIVDDPRTVAGVDALIAAGLIPANRREIILAKV